MLCTTPYFLSCLQLEGYKYKSWQRKASLILTLVNNVGAEKKEETLWEHVFFLSCLLHYYGGRSGKGRSGGRGRPGKFKGYIMCERDHVLLYAQARSSEYNADIQLYTIRYAMLEQLRNPPEGMFICLPISLSVCLSVCFCLALFPGCLFQPLPL